MTFIAAWANWKMALERSKDFLRFQFAEHWCFDLKSIHGYFECLKSHFCQVFRLKQVSIHNIMNIHSW